MKESEYLTSLAQEFWDTDQVLFPCGLLPRDWLPVSEPAECNEVKMWESVDFSACAKNNVLFASDGSGRSRKTTQTLRQVALGVATFDMHIGNGHMWARSTHMLAILELISAWPESRYFYPLVLRSQMNTLWKSWSLVFLLSHQLWCKANLAQTVLSLMDWMLALSLGTCGKDASPAHLARSQPDVSTQCAHVGYPGVELERDAKRKFVAQPEISHEAAELIVRNHSSHRREISWYHTRQPPSRLAAWARERVFLYTVWCRQRWWSFEATEVSVRRIWRIPSESETQA